MISEFSLLGHPIPWLLASAVCVGGALSRLTRRLKSHDPERRKRESAVRWVAFCLWLTSAAGLLTFGLIRPGVERFFDETLYWMLGVACLGSFLAFRFRQAVGLPILILSIVSVVLLLLFFQSLAAYTGETEIARVRILSATESEMTLEVVRPEHVPELVDLSGQYFAPIVRVVIFDDRLVFLGSKTWYRFEGVTSFTMVRKGNEFRIRQTDSDYYFPHPSGISAWMWEWFERNEATIPGVRSVQVELDLKRIPETAPGQQLQVLSVRVQNDGGIQLIRETS